MAYAAAALAVIKCLIHVNKSKSLHEEDGIAITATAEPYGGNNGERTRRDGDSEQHKGHQLLRIEQIADTFFTGFAVPYWAYLDDTIPTLCLSPLPVQEKNTTAANMESVLEIFAVGVAGFRAVCADPFAPSCTRERDLQRMDSLQTFAVPPLLAAIYVPTSWYGLSRITTYWGLCTKHKDILAGGSAAFQTVRRVTFLQTQLRGGLRHMAKHNSVPALFFPPAPVVPASHSHLEGQDSWPIAVVFLEDIPCRDR
ncbi:hypothetical protein BDR04DRAFT_1121740 [Suillus decipiens]|nr:hypothetical protein BDR04DRAFT_1121740 [Suillus decipiens]